MWSNKAQDSTCCVPFFKMQSSYFTVLVGEQSTANSVPVCLSAAISQKPYVQISRTFLHFTSGHALVLFW